MGANFKFFSDPGAANEIVTLQRFNQLADGSTGPVDLLVYFGSANAAVVAKSRAQPGVAQVQAMVVDTLGGLGHPASEVRLASSQAGLASATPGAPLNLGLSVAGGVANLKPVWLRVLDSTHSVTAGNGLVIQATPLTVSPA